MSNRMTGQQLRTWRQTIAHLNQQQFADAIGVSRHQVIRYEGKPDGEIPKTWELACAAIVHGITEYDGT